MSIRYCTEPPHQDGEHDPACAPPADPGNPELRLYRAIWGLCPDCDKAEDHEHFVNPRNAYPNTAEGNSAHVRLSINQAGLTEEVEAQALVIAEFRTARKERA